jgi:fucose permease
VLTGSMLRKVVGALLIAVPAPAWVAVLGLVLIGGAAAPVFPLLTLTTADRVGAQYADRAIGVQVGAAAAGGAGLPAAIGAVIGRWGLDSLGFALMVLAVGLLALHVLPALGARANQG